MKIKCYVCKGERANKMQKHFDGSIVIVCENCFVPDGLVIKLKNKTFLTGSVNNLTQRITFLTL